METENGRHSRPATEAKTIDLSADEVKDLPPTEAEGTEEEGRATTEAEESASRADDTGQSPADDAGIEHAQGARSTEERASPRHERSLPLVAAGLIGGILALGGAAGLQYWGVIPNMSADEQNAAALGVLNSEVQSLKSSLADVANSKPQVDLAPINQRLDQYEKRLADVPKANGLSVEADQRISALNNEIEALKHEVETSDQKYGDSLAQLVMRVEAMEKKANEPGEDVAVAVAIASAGLKAAIDRGGPFEPELQTLADVSPDDPAVQALKPFAAKGVPSRAALLQDFPPTADAMLAVTREHNPDQSLTDRLLQSAFSAIKVRPVGNVEGEGPDAVIARIEDRLSSGDLKGAQAEWSKLPEEAKAAGADYKEKLDARIKVEDLISGTLSRAVSGTGTKG